MPTIKINIQAENIGIHSLLSKEIDSSSCRLGFYANNGCGKTFLSKAFALYEEAQITTPSIANVNRLLAFGQDSGVFKFEVKGIEPASPAETLKMRLTRDTGVSIESSSKYKFHVFNSDYVKKHLEERSYSPDGDIKGLILGAENIDVEKEEKQLSDLESERETVEAQLRGTMENGRRSMSDFGVRSNITEFAELTYENLIVDKFGSSKTEKFDVLVEKYRKLESMPEDLEDAVNFSVPSFDDIFSEISELLTTSYSSSSFTGDFKARMRERNDFVREGLAFVTDSECPFCEQEFSSKAEILIDQYRRFLDDEEAKVIENCKRLRRLCKSRQDNLRAIYSEWVKLRAKFEEIKSYLPSSNDLILSGIKDLTSLDKSFELIADLLLKKEGDVSLAIEPDEIKSTISEILEYQTRLSVTELQNTKTITDINKRKNDQKGQRLEVKRQLCLAKVMQLRDSLSKEIFRLQQIRTEINSLRDDIQEKRNKNKRDKKKEVSKTLKELLNLFFAEKYSFDEEKFCLTFSDSRLANNADDVLSDGEKGVVAFCHYLATTHCLVDSDDDYKNLFFIIDDPISSMDFHFVYKVADCLRRLNLLFPPIGDRIRYLIFTHNLEFISILGRNGICNHTFALRNGVIERADCTAALPYEPHLEDILRVSLGSDDPNHTTPNSIRHTLETIGKFLRPGTSFEVFFEEIDELKSDPYLWSFIQDQSHGSVRTQPSFVPEDIKRSCGLVVNYVRTNFPYQVSSIEARIKPN